MPLISAISKSRFFIVKETATVSCGSLFVICQSNRKIGVGVQTAVCPGPRQVLVVGLAADHRAVVPAQGQRRQV